MRTSGVRSHETRQTFTGERLLTMNSLAEVYDWIKIYPVS